MLRFLACTATAKNVAEEINTAVDASNIDTYPYAASANGLDPASHYFCGWAMEDDQYNAFLAERQNRIDLGDINAGDIVVFSSLNSGLSTLSLKHISKED